MDSLYHWLLLLYPPEYRSEFGDEMMAVFREAKTGTWQKGVLARAAFCAREAGGLLCGALEEHLRVLTGSDFLGLFGSRRFGMRSEFRFPKATVALMAIILAALVMAIEKAKAISAAVPHTNPPVVPVISVQVTIVPTLLLVIAMAVVAGALGWAVLFALRRSGVQRFSGFKASGGPGL
jgi:hypothetical protein